MSRIGKKPIQVPAGVKVAVTAQGVNVEGPKGKASLKLPLGVKAAWAESEKAITISVDEKSGADPKQLNADWGSTRAHVRNMVEGVTKGYEKVMQVVGTGWSAALSGKTLKLVLGYANPIMMDIPEGVTVVVEKPTGDMTPVKVSGVDRQAVGQFAAAMRQKRKPEPYNGKGVKYSTEVITRKQGKQFGA